MAEDEMQELFQNACSYVRTHSGALKSDDLLYFYARFKQVKSLFIDWCYSQYSGVRSKSKRPPNQNVPGQKAHKPKRPQYQAPFE